MGLNQKSNIWAVILNIESLYPSKEIIKVVLADSQTIVRHGLAHAVAQQEDMVIVGETSDGEQALKLVADYQPNILILDIPLLSLSGVEVTQLLRKAYQKQQVTRETHVVVFSAYGDQQYVWSLLTSGARGYILKTEPVSSVLNAVRQVQKGNVVLSPSLQAVLVEFIVNQDFTLSDREITIFKLLARGYSNKEIGQELSITEKTVQQHLQNSYRKLPFVRNRAEAVSWAWINRLVS